MPATQREISVQTLQQLQLLDPSVSAEVGTPERLLLDTFAQGIADSQIDLTALQGQLDVDSKFGANLDNFLGLFRFGRQTAVRARGAVSFGRSIVSTSDIRIPAGTQVLAAPTPGVQVIFATQVEAILAAGDLDILVPVQAIAAGTSGNVAAGTINITVGDPVFGITVITNPQAMTGGKESESDDEYKTRFKNTIFRNLAGTRDQYLALAIALPYSTKANVVGPISRYKEYIQIPEVDDASGYDVDSDSVVEPGESGNGNSNEYTTALSSIPYSKYIYDTVPYFVSNGKSGLGSFFYRPDVDYEFNTLEADKDRGDAHRFWSAGIGNDPANSPYQPNVTFINAYTGTDSTVEAARPGDIVLFEHSYLSDASRNDVTRNVTNAVDVYINGGNDSLASTILPPPTTASIFVNDPTSKFHWDNYRRLGEREHRPVLGNILMPLYWEPVTDIPLTIVATVDGIAYEFQRDVHYWAVEDVSILAGSISARNGIEWSMDNPATVSGHDDLFITDPNIDTIAITDYSFDQNVVDLQALYDSSGTQVTAHTLAHRARTRYFKLDITVMYTAGAAQAETNQDIAGSVKSLLDSQFFGSTVQLSDLLQAIHNTPGVDNVRWTSDVIGSSDLLRVIETDRFGRPLLNVLVDPIVLGVTGIQQKEQLVITGTPTGGNFALKYNGEWTEALPYNANAGAIQSALNAIPVSADVTVSGIGTLEDPFIITWNATGVQSGIQVTPYPASVISSVPLVNNSRNLFGNTYVFNNDFFLKDDELPSLALVADDTTFGVQTDTLPGLVIRPRAQNTWQR